MFKQGIGERVNSWHPFTGTQHVDFTIQGNESNNKKKKINMEEAENTEKFEFSI